MSKKRILIFSTAYFPLIGGAEIAVKEITDRLTDFEFVMITAKIDPSLSTHDRHGNIEYYRLGRGNWFDKYRLILQGPRFAQTLGEFDGIWAIMASYAGFAALRYKQRHPNVPYLLTLQEGDSRWDIYKHVWWCWPYFKKIFTKADRIQAISNYLAQWAKDMGATCPIDVVPNGASFYADELVLKENLLEKDNFTSAQIKPEFVNEIEKIDKKYELTQDGVLIVTVSRLVKKNGVGDLIKAMKYLPDFYKLRIVGEGKLGGKLKRLTKKLKLESRVFFEGLVPHNKIWMYYHSAKVFVRPSLSEGLGNVFFEAMHLRKPVISTSVGGIPDFLKEGETGWFCEPKNPKSIADKILYILNTEHKAEVQRVVENARKMVERKYSWEGIALQMSKVIDSV